MKSPKAPLVVLPPTGLMEAINFEAMYRLDWSLI
nr:MAG TPA: hypothetical protein [Bacteriophage sp.]